jgi:hypothetical protein
VLSPLHLLLMDKVERVWMQELTAQLLGYAAGRPVQFSAFRRSLQGMQIALLLQVEGVWLQDLSAQLPGYAGVGPCLVLPNLMCY